MKKRNDNVIPVENRRAITTKELAELLSIGRDSAVKIGTRANAKISIGRSVRWNLQKVNAYIDTLAE